MGCAGWRGGGQNPRLYRLPHLTDEELDALVLEAHRRYHRRPLAAARLLLHLPGGTLMTLAKRTLKDLKQYL